MNARALWLACASAFVLTACGGGSGAADSDAPAPSPPSAAPQVSYASPQDYEQNLAIPPLAPVVSGTATSFSVKPALPPGLTINEVTGAISGTPTIYAVADDYVVTATGPGGTTTTSLHLAVTPVAAVSRPVLAGTEVHIEIQQSKPYWQSFSFSEPAYAKLVDTQGVLSPAVEVTLNASDATLVINIPTVSTTPVGIHVGRAVLSLCRDAECTRFQPIPRVLVDYNINVLQADGAWPGDQLTPLTGVLNAPDWSTFQGNAAHDGYVPVKLDPNRVSARWQTMVPALLSSYGFVNLAMVTTHNDMIFMAGNNAVTARSEYDGSIVWSRSFSDLEFPSVNPPAVVDGMVYVTAGQQTSSTLFALFASNGQERYRVPMPSQTEHVLAPVADSSRVFANAGSFAGLYVGPSEGATFYSDAAPQQSSWTPAVGGQSVYAYSGDALRVFDSTTGALKAKIADPTFSESFQEVGGSAVFNGHLTVFAANYAKGVLNGNSLMSFDLRTNSVDWTVEGSYTATPAYDGTLYAVNNKPLQLEARSGLDGALLWSWAPPAGDSKFVSEVLLTRGAVLVSTNVATYAIDTRTHRTLWSFPASGNLALSRNGVLYIAHHGPPGTRMMKLTALNLNGNGAPRPGGYP